MLAFVQALTFHMELICTCYSRISWEKQEFMVYVHSKGMITLNTNINQRSMKGSEILRLQWDYINHNIYGANKSCDVTIGSSMLM